MAPVNPVPLAGSSCGQAGVLHSPRKLGDGLFLQCCREVAARYPQITFENMIVDNTTMQVVGLPCCTGLPWVHGPTGAPTPDCSSLPHSWCPGPSSLMSW